MTPDTALAILTACSLTVDSNFLTLSSSQVAELLTHADRVKYRKPANANASRGSYFHAMLTRKAAKAAAPRFTLPYGGREIYLDGKHVFTLDLHREQATNSPNMKPWELDELGKRIVELLNTHGFTAKL